MSSKRRPYLKLKESFIDMFRGQARWLKETYDKESIFEKPYLDGDYRAMHLDIPKPDWGGRKEGLEGFWPKGIGRSFFFEPAECGFSISGSIACGDTTTFTASMTMIPPSEDARFEWSVTSNREEVRVIGIEPDSFTTSAKITLATKEDFDGTATIAVYSRLSGTYQKLLRVVVPEYLDSGFAFDVRYESALSLPYLQNEKYSGLIHNCGVEDLVVTCCNDTTIAWNSTLSATTIVRSTEAIIAITDSLGQGEPYYWSVSGTGFSVLRPVTTSLTNMLIADETACGTATVTVTGCDGKVVTGYVRCTTGNWYLVDTCTQNGGYTSNCKEYIKDDYKFYHCGWCCNPATCGTDTSCCSGWGPHAAADCVYCAAQPTNTSMNGTVEKYEWRC